MFGIETRTVKAILLVANLLLVSSLAFGLGRLSVLEEEREPVRIEYDFSAAAYEPDTFTEAIPIEEGSVVGSKNSDVYHLPWCSGAQRITADNLVVFDSRTEAETAGYRPAGNCPGL